MATKARLDVNFPLRGDFFETSETIRKVAEKHKGKLCDSGAGFGQRDMAFEFDHYKDACAAEKAIIKLKIKDLQVE